MKFTAWDAKRHIERSYRTALKKLVRFVLALMDNVDDTDEAEEVLEDFSRSEQLDDWSYAVSKTMVTNTLEENARTWRQAARMSGEGRRIYNALQTELEGPVGDRVRELIDRNAEYIKSVPSDVAKQLVRHVQTEAYADNRKIYGTEDFRQYVGEMTDYHAKLISRTETAKAMSALTQARAESLGHDWYIWHTAEDGRVRDSHKLMDGVLCRYSDQPAPEELNGEKSSYGHYGPGEIFNCRCFAEPIILWREITWPCKVYAGGAISKMDKNEFEQQFGMAA